jgi:hypothetical protein
LWSYERFHDLDLHAGELLLSALITPPYDDGARLALLDAAEQHVPRELLAAIPEDGLTPDHLHARLDGTSYVAAAEFADWQWGQTESILSAIQEPPRLPQLIPGTRRTRDRPEAIRCSGRSSPALFQQERPHARARTITRPGLPLACPTRTRESSPR